MKGRQWLGSVAAVIGICVLGGAPASAGTDTGGSGGATPVVVPGTYDIQPNEVVEVAIAGFSSRTVTVALCGNAGLRGSADCNLGASESTRSNADRSPRVVELVATPPPVACPCLIRVSSPTNDEVVTVDVELVGHPVAEPYGGRDEPDPLVVSVRAEAAGDGLAAWTKASLGGSRAYEVTVTVGNAAAVPATTLRARAFAGRDDGHVLEEFEVPVPANLAAGETWAHTTRVELPAPTWGEAVWRVDVSGSRPTTTATDATTHQPVLLYVLLTFLAVDLLFLTTRLVTRSARAARRRRTRPNIAEPPAPEAVIDDSAEERERDLELV